MPNMPNEPVAPIAPLSAPSSTPPTTPSGAVSATPPTDTRLPDDASIPEWARGKTLAEALAVGQSAVQAVETYIRAPLAPTPQAAPAQPQAAPSFADTDYVTGADLRTIQQQALSQVGNQFNSVAEQNARIAYGMISRDPAYADTFRHYGPEIHATLASVPKQSWTLDNLETVVNLVRGKHVNEIVARERAQFVATMEPSMRASGAAGTGPASTTHSSPMENEKIPADWRERAKRQGIDERTIREFAYANDMTEEAFYKQWLDGKVITDAVADLGPKSR